MREKVVEQRLIRAVSQSGGLALKFVSPNLNGVPDRLLLFPGGRIAFAEVKAPGEKPRPLQVHRIARLRELGFRVYVVDSVEGISEMLEDIKTGIAIQTAGPSERSGRRSESLDEERGRL